MTPLRILIVDDHVLVRHGLRLLIEEHPATVVVGEASSGEEALILAEKLNPDVILMDVHMPKGLDGITAARHIHEILPHIRVIMLTMFDDDAHVEKMLAAGVAGVLFKHDDSAEILEAILCAQQHAPHLPHRISEGSRRRLLASLAQRGEESLLTARETEVLVCLANGFTNKEIAGKLVISVKTVETHRANIMKRLDLQTRSDLVDYALKNGFLENPHAP